MAQYIKQGNIFGRIGTGIGKGLAEQVPKEIERNRLASGLKNFEQDHQNLNPMQQLARLSAIPGITPQMVQSFAELAKYQNQGNAFKNAAGRAQGQPKASPDLTEVKQANLLDQAANSGMPMQQGFNPTQGQASQEGMETNGQERKEPQVQEGKLGHPYPSIPGMSQLSNYNLGDPRAITKLPWSPQKRNEVISDYLDQGFLPPQARELAAEDEQRDLGTAPAVQKQQQEKKSRKEEAERLLTEQLETRLQKTGTGVYNDITGDMLADLKRAMSKAVVENPNASAEDIAEDFSKRALNLAKVKNDVKGLAAKTGIESIWQGDKVLNKLRTYQHIFKDAGNQEEYYNLLRSEFGLSQQGAALLAFPAQPEMKKFISTYKPESIKWGAYGPQAAPEKIENNARKAALQVEKLIDEDDSVLAIARMLSEKDPYFDQRVFFEQLSDNPNSKLNPRQRKELGEGEKDSLPTWGDIKIFPAFRRSTK